MAIDYEKYKGETGNIINNYLVVANDLTCRFELDVFDNYVKCVSANPCSIIIKTS